MIAFYDFAISPPSYDFVTFMSVAKAMARDRRDSLHVVFVPGPNNGFKEKTVKPISMAEHKFRFRHIVLPLCGLWQCGYTVCQTRDEARRYDTKDCYPLDYSVDVPTWGHTMGRATDRVRDGGALVFPSPSQGAVDMVAGHFPERPFVITLRECYVRERNSVLPAWLEFAAEVKKDFPVVFVRDTAKAAEPIEGFEISPMASLDVDYRLALYHRAEMQFCVGGGPPMLLYYSDLPYRVFKSHVEAWPMCSAGYLAKIGFPVGSQLPWAKDHQKAVWTDDSAESLLGEYEAWKKSL